MMIRDDHQIVTIQAKDQGLARMELGLAALRKGSDKEAARHLDAAMGISSGVPTADINALLARSYFWDEATKNFIGEPYERALCAFYRGILYWKAADLENARACFRSSVILSSGGEALVPGDFSIFDYLDGFATHLLHQTDQGKLKQARELNRRTSLPDYDNNNVSIFLEIGEGPVKVREGSSEERLAYRRPSCDVASVRLSGMGKTVQVPFWEDILEQAHRHGRAEMNAILSKKAALKLEKEKSADILLRGGTITKTNRWGKSTISGNIPGILNKLVADNTKPQADIRGWENLPQFLAFATFRANSGSHALKVEFLDRDGITIETLTQNLSIVVPDTGVATALVYTPGKRGSPRKRLAGHLEDLFAAVPDARAFPVFTETIQGPKDKVWDAVIRALELREKSLLSPLGIEGNRDTGLIRTRVSRHGVLGFPLYRQYLIEVTEKSAAESQIRFVQLLYRIHVPRREGEPVGQSSIDANGRDVRDQVETVSPKDQPAFQSAAGMSNFVQFKREQQSDVHQREKRAFLQVVHKKLLE